MKYRHNKSRAFTLVEILTTVAIIGILLAMLIPALNQVGKHALIVKQKAQFHAIELAMEAFRSDVGDYPPSTYDFGTYGHYSASQRLAEAIIGRDGFGFHPASRYHRDGLGAAGNATLQPLYYPWIDSFTPEAKADNLAARKGPYLELESANAVPLLSYGIYGELVNGAQPSYVLADVFRTAKLTTGRKVGMPILYYKANRLNTRHAWTAGDTSDTLADATYNVYDSISGIILAHGFVNNPHPIYSDPGWFYQKTQNPNFQNPARPYRAESFILHSAGPDGKYGTADDVFNFVEGN